MLYVLPWGQMSFWAACVITNFFSAIPYIGTDLVEFIESPTTKLLGAPLTILPFLLIIFILPTFGNINPRALRKVVLRSQNDKLYALDIPYNFLSLLIGLIDGDGYLSITKTSAGYIRLGLIISLHPRDTELLEYVKSVIKIGRINFYPNSNVVQYVVSRTDLQEVFIPLMQHHGLFFLTDTRRAQFDKLMYIIHNDIKLFSQLPDSTLITPFCAPLPSDPLGYTQLPFFSNWIVGFTLSEGSFYVKKNSSVNFSLRQRSHPILFEAFKIFFNTPVKIDNHDGYSKFVVSSAKDIQTVINFFSNTPNIHPLIGYKFTQYCEWIKEIGDNPRYCHLTLPNCRQQNI
jgi:hypothetical protein